MNLRRNWIQKSLIAIVVFFLLTIVVPQQAQPRLIAAEPTKSPTPTFAADESWQPDRSFISLSAQTSLKQRQLSADEREQVAHQYLSEKWKYESQLNEEQSQTPLTANQANGPIAFVGTDGNLWVMDPDGNNQRQLTTTFSDVEDPTWSPDGHQIVFATDNNSKVYVINVDDTDTDPNPIVSDFVSVGLFSWSPNGTRILFTGTEPGKTRGTYIVNADGTNRTQLATELGEHSLGASWSPNGEWIAFPARKANGSWGIYKLEVESLEGDWRPGEFDCSTVFNCACEDAPYTYFTKWSPNGLKIAFVGVRSEWHLCGFRFCCRIVAGVYLVDTDGGANPQLIGDLSSDENPTNKASFGELVMASNAFNLSAPAVRADALRHICTASVSGGVSALNGQTTEADSSVSVDWSPDGLRLVASLTQDGMDNMYIVDPIADDWGTPVAQGNVPDWDQQMPPIAPNISGQVIGFNGKPLKNIKVHLVGLHSTPRIDLTDEDGKFVFENLANDEYLVSLERHEVFELDYEARTVIIPSGNTHLVFYEEGATDCESIVAGIEVCENDEQHTAVIDLDNEDIYIELANEPVNPGNGLFKLKSVEELVSGYSSAGTDNDKILHPYLAINGTGFSESNEVSDSERYISKNSILSIDGKPYGFNCGTDATLPEDCFHNEAPLDESYYLSTSFMTYSANGVPEAWVHRASVDFAEEPRDYVADRKYYSDTTKIVDFAVGYQSALLDALTEGAQDEELIFGFPEYVANPGDHGNRTARTAIGVSCDDDGRKLFLSTVIPKPPINLPNPTNPPQADITTAKWMRDLQKQGACRVIMLDGGGSPQFSGRGENDEGIDFHAWHDSSWCIWCPRPVINAIVAYNDSINLIKNQTLSPAGGTFSPYSHVIIHFAANTFASPVEVIYAPAVRTDREDLLDVGVIYRLEASDQTDIEGSNELDTIQPNKPYQIVLQYFQDNVSLNADESKLALYFWNGTDWEIEPTSVVDTANNTVTAHPKRFGKWALLTNPIYHNYLPIIQR